MKLAIVVDSSCGLTKKQAEERGWFFLPLYINIDGKEYADGVDITPKNFKEIYKKSSICSTSCTPPGEVIKLFEKISKTHDFVVFYPISQYLSSQYQNIELLSRSYKNVFVIKSSNVSQMIIFDLVEFEKNVLRNEITVKQGIQKIENKNSNIPQALLVPKTMDALVRGGRLSPSAAKMAKLLKIVPVIGVQNGKLEKYNKGRIFNKVIINFGESFLGKQFSKNKNQIIVVFNVENNDVDTLFSEIKTKINYDKEIIVVYMPPVVAIHTGFESIGFGIYNLEFDIAEYKIPKLLSNI